MSWVKLDDRLAHHRKVRAITPRLVLAAYGLYVAGVQFAQRDETDGRIRPEDLRVVMPTVPHPPKRLAEELVRVRLWDTHPDGGWVIHDYLEHNLSAAERATQKAGTAQRQRKYRDALVTRDGTSESRVSRSVYSSPLPSRPLP